VRGYRRVALWLAAVALAVTAGCTGQGWFGHEAPAEDVEFAKSYIALFASRAYPAIEMGMDPTLKDPQIKLKIAQMASAFPPGPPTSVRVVRSLSTSSGGDTTSNVTLQYEYPGRWVVADVIVARHNHAAVIKGVQIQPVRESLDRLNRVTFAGKGPGHAIVLVVAALVFVFVLWTFGLAIRTPAPGLKWAWAVFVLLGFFRFVFNWTAGTLTIVPLGLQLLGTTFSKPSAFDPLIISTSIPVGAIVYLLQRRDWRQDGAIPPPPAP